MENKALPPHCADQKDSSSTSRTALAMNTHTKHKFTQLPQISARSLLSHVIAVFLNQPIPSLGPISPDEVNSS